MRGEIVRDERLTGLSVGWLTSETARGKEQRGSGGEVGKREKM